MPAAWSIHSDWWPMTINTVRWVWANFHWHARYIVHSKSYRHFRTICRWCWRFQRFDIVSIVISQKHCLLTENLQPVLLECQSTITPPVYFSIPLSVYFVVSRSKKERQKNHSIRFEKKCHKVLCIFIRTSNKKWQAPLLNAKKWLQFACESVSFPNKGSSAVIQRMKMTRMVRVAKSFDSTVSVNLSHHQFVDILYLHIAFAHKKQVLIFPIWRSCFVNDN